jgi:hypothetical protein
LGLLIWAVVFIVAAAIWVTVQRGAPLNDVLAFFVSNAGRIAGIIFGTLFEFAFLGLLAMILNIVVHEGGHVLGGKLAGFRFLWMVLGPVKIASTRDGVKIMRPGQHDPRPGATLTVPVTTDNLRWSTAAVTAAGPLATLALCLACWWLSGVTQGSTGKFLWLTGLWALLLTVANLLPVKTGGLPSDGARLKLLWLGGPRADRLCYVSMISGASLMGKRPREWDVDWISRSTALDDHTLEDAAACHVAFYWALDVGNVNEAERYLRRLIAENTAIPPTIRALFFVDAAFFYAYYRPDPATARRYLNEAGEQKGSRRQMWLRAEAATLAAEGKPGEARCRAQEGLDEITRDPPIGPGWELDKEWLETLAGVSRQVPVYE